MQTKFKFKNIHSCEAVVLSCIDFRFWKETMEFVENELNIKSFDFPSLPGAAKMINESVDGDAADQCIDVPVRLHHVQKIIIVNHEDCGAYGGSAKFGKDREEEQEFHTRELNKAKKKLSLKYPDKEIILVYAKLIDNGDNIKFVLIV